MTQAPFTQKSLTKLQQERAALFAEADQIQGVLTDTEDEKERETLDEQFNAIMTKADQLQADIERAEALIEKVKGLGQSRDTVVKPVQLDSVEDSKTDEIKIKIHASAIRTPVQNFRQEKIDGMTPEHRAYAFGRYLFATAARTCPGKFGHFAKYITAHEDNFGPLNAATEGGNAGIWVPPHFGTDLSTLMQKFGVARQLLDMKTMFSDKRTDPKEGSDPVPVYVGEGAEGSDVSVSDDSSITLTAKKLMAILINSSEVNEDAIMEMGDSFLRRTANGFAKAEDQAAWLGDGSSSYGGITGFNVKIRDVDGIGTVGKGLEVGTAPASSYGSMTLIDFENLVSLQPHFAASSEDANVFVCHKQFYYRAMVQLMLASGGVTAAETAAGRNQPVFMGYPVIFSNVFSTTPATNQIVCTFGDHRRAASFGDRRAYSIDFSEHATVGSVNLWSSDQIGIKATERFDIQVHGLGDASTPGAVVALSTAAS